MERERGFRRRHLGLSTPSPQCSLVELSPGSVFRVGSRQLYVKKAWQGRT
jgi:hypothetical protein